MSDCRVSMAKVFRTILLALAVGIVLFGPVAGSIQIGSVVYYLTWRIVGDSDFVSYELVVQHIVICG